MQVMGFTRLTQFCYQVVSSLLASSSCIKPVGFIKLHQACWLHQVASSLLASSSCIKPVGFIKLHQACWLHQVASSLLASSSCIKSVKIRLDATWYLQTSCNLLKQLASSLWIKSPDNQLASSLLTTCSRFVVIEPEQAMQTHPDIGSMTAK